MKHLDLFSGIGGFALAASWVWGNDYQNIGFCDIEKFSQLVLETHWPASPIYDDIRKLTRKHYSRVYGDPGTVDLITGGFPCQPFSTAGKRLGTADNRHLWPEMLRVIREFHPRWIIGENVGGFVTWSGGLVLEQVHTDLESEGYEVQAFIIPACAVNAPHRRDRVWIVAHAINDRQGRTQPRSIEAPDSLPQEYRPQHSTAWEPKRTDHDGSDTQFAPNTSGEGLERQLSKPKQVGCHARQETKPRSTAGSWSEDWPEVAARLCRVDDGLPRRMDRAARLKALGNAIVPQVAAEIMSSIKAIDYL